MVLGTWVLLLLLQLPCLHPTYHQFQEGPDGAPNVDDAGEKTGDQEHDGESGPGLSPAHLHLAGVDNDPVPVHCDGHDGQRGHEHRHAGERLDEPAEGRVVGKHPGHVESVHHSQGD